MSQSPALYPPRKPPMKRMPASQSRAKPGAAGPRTVAPRAVLPLRPVVPAQPRPRPALGRALPDGSVAFGDAAQAWFWTLGALAARRDGTSRGGGTGIRRPCDPDDVIRALDLLHRRGGIDLSHARVLRRWGERGRSPESSREAEQADALLWSEALERLEGLLRAKGIVATAE